jgi:hypothetical protein
MPWWQTRPMRQARRAAPQPPPEGRSGLDLKMVLELAGSVAAPVTVITGLLFYFGWAYTGAFYGYFAIDRTMLDLSVRDYLLRSVNPMLWPVIFWLTLAGVWTWAHGLLVRNSSGEPGRLRVQRLGVVIGGVGGACFLTGVLAASIGDPYTSLPRELMAPLGLAAGAALIGYGSHLHRRAQDPRFGSPRGAGESRLARSVGLGVLALLVTVCLLWATADFAAALGRGDSLHLAERHFSDRPAVVLYSPERLFLDPYGGVQEVPLGDKDDSTGSAMPICGC